ncbi:lymphatic vessel endothelial hyaluronic acid receptor 1a [Acanthochromis polyacanthus]|uniref:lymphatic vessel endothelial hyaluronic acid receptor 1a n=1 Tax=Acanthochromis polyacanthus TaxID=80966 RepID=UPI0022341253|nr:lymphatic vessel endothelial hyaluronic acid receptor 1a [Acanthochromis polyacanthus]
MNIIWLCITSALTFTSVCSDEMTEIINIRVFPAETQSIAGVIQVTSLNDLNQPQYAFNASEARRICLFLGLSIATKAQVERALSRGLETCRFGWIDEHFVVIPRIQALANCGQNQTGLVPWRASVTRKFDVFCFNESDAAEQLKDETTDSPLSSRYSSGNPQSPTLATNSTLTENSTASSSRLPSSYSTPYNVDIAEQPARIVGSAQGSSGGKAVLITCTCGLLLTAIIIFAYLKLRRRCSLSSDTEKPEE